MRLGQRRPVLLSVDDNRAIHEVYALAFEKHYTHVRAYGGTEALGIVRSQTVDVVILDLVMPDLNGLEVLERALKVKPGLMVIIASVIDTSRSALRALRRGATEPDADVQRGRGRRRRQGRAGIGWPGPLDRRRGAEDQGTPLRR